MSGNFFDLDGLIKSLMVAGIIIGIVICGLVYGGYCCATRTRSVGVGDDRTYGVT